MRRAWNYFFDEKRFGISRLPLPAKVFTYIWVYFWGVGVAAAIGLGIYELIALSVR